MLSIWEKQQLVKKDIVIIGSGITGLSAAAYLGEHHPDRQVTIVEKGALPSGASTKNAGFACFGSVSEIVDDLIHMPENEVLQLIELRLKGLAVLKHRLGEKPIGFEQWGGHELITSENSWYLDKIDYINEMLQPLFKRRCFEVRNELIPAFGFGVEKDAQLVYTPFEGQLDTGKMMQQLMALVRSFGVETFTNTEVQHIDDLGHQVILETSNGLSLSARQVLVANNGFVAKLLPQIDVQPGRGLVLATSPISSLKIRGTFHMKMGYYYFRNFHDRVIFGGGRNLDFEGETTTDEDINPKIMKHLQKMLQDMILPGHDYRIESAWTGTMGFGQSKSATLQAVSANVFVGVGLGGMGVAIGSIIGEELAKLCLTGNKAEI
ncbi:MAG: FAD-dependent oxidoreductase [Bacteroidota bacterium]